MKLPVVIGTALLTLGLAIGIEVAIFMSKRHNDYGIFQPFSA